MRKAFARLCGVGYILFWCILAYASFFPGQPHALDKILLSSNSAIMALAIFLILGPIIFWIGFKLWHTTIEAKQVNKK